LEEAWLGGQGSVVLDQKLNHLIAEMMFFSDKQSYTKDVEGSSACILMNTSSFEPCVDEPFGCT
jgi:hypothetical protein